ncbi:hypothetical protein MPSEU_000914400 [Mayamaea pseudoterrestris]|nr:hypothetical protein MPSEU_000914400 [Mayamaea pseudoterrestris]
MVILTAAAIGAAGYGVYKGGQAAVQKGKELATEHERGQKRREQSSELNTKASSRQERIAKLNSLRTMEPTASLSSSSSSDSASSESQRQKNVVASFRARQEATKSERGLKGLLKRGGK